MIKIIKTLTIYLALFLFNIIFWNAIIEEKLFISSEGYLDPNFGRKGKALKNVIFGREGFSKMQLDSLGFNNNIYPLHKKPNKKRIVIVGDSYTEAFQVQRKNNFCSLLNKKLGSDFEVINLGMSGATMSDHIYSSKFISETLNPDHVIIEINSYSDFGENNFNKKNWLYINKENDDYSIKSNYSINTSTKVKNKLYSLSGFSGFLILRLKEFLYTFNKKEVKNEIENLECFTLTKKETDEIKKMTGWSLAQLKKNYPSFTILSLGGLPIIGENKIKADKTKHLQDQKEKIIENSIKLSNVKIIEVKDSFLETSKKEKKMLTGFNNKKIGDGHLNNDGHLLVAEILFNHFNNH